MRKIKEILRLCWEKGLSARQAAQSCGVGRATVNEYLERAGKAGLSWPLPEDLDETSLENLLFPSSIPLDTVRRNMPPFEQGVEEKAHDSPAPLGGIQGEQPRRLPVQPVLPPLPGMGEGTRYCPSPGLQSGRKALRRLCRHHDPNPRSGEVIPAYLFVATLGGSNYSYVEAVLSRELPSWIKSHIHTFEYMGAVPEIVIPDNVRTGVTHPCRYEPDLNPTYQDAMVHYGTTVIPARVKKVEAPASIGPTPRR